MIIHRRQILTAAAAMGAVGAVSGALAATRDRDQKLAIAGDDGTPVAHMRVPAELIFRMDKLQGVVWVGSTSPSVILVEFFDYNCPYCRTAVSEIDALMRSAPDMRLGLVNNPILSLMSAQAAKVALALLSLKGPAATYDFHRRLFEGRGVIDGLKALEIAQMGGVSREELEDLADGNHVQELLSAQLRLASALGFAATPSFIIAATGVLGYPGPTTLKAMVAAVRRCGQIAC